MGDPMIVVAAAVAGLLFGSFANVVIWRVPRSESVVRPPSRCPSCGKTLRARDNVPVLSWIALRGRCANCTTRISVRYPIIEALCGVLFGLAAWLLPRATDLVAYLPVLWVLVVLSAIDLERKILPNKIVLPAIAASIVLFAASAMLGPGLDAWLRGLAAGAAGFAFLFLLALISPAGMGMGDVKLAALLGLALGYLPRGFGRLFVGFMVAFMAGAVGGLLLMLVRRGGLKSQIPFGPYLAFGTIAAVLWGDEILTLWLGA